MYKKMLISNSLHYIFGCAPMGQSWHLSPFSPRNLHGSQSTVSENIIWICQKWIWFLFFWHVIVIYSDCSGVLSILSYQSVRFNVFFQILKLPIKSYGCTYLISILKDERFKKKDSISQLSHFNVNHCIAVRWREFLSKTQPGHCHLFHLFTSFILPWM